MGQIDVMFTIGIHGSLQCEEDDAQGQLEEARDKVGSWVEFGFPANVGEVSVEVVSIADIDPETGNLQQRPQLEMKINPN